MFAPPFGPPDFVRSASGLHDDPLFGETGLPVKASQGGFYEPRLEGDPSGLTVGIEFFGHSQRLDRGCDAPGSQ